MQKINHQQFLFVADAVRMLGMKEQYDALVSSSNNTMNRDLDVELFRANVDKKLIGSHLDEWIHRIAGIQIQPKRYYTREGFVIITHSPAQLLLDFHGSPNYPLTLPAVKVPSYGNYNLQVAIPTSENPDGQETLDRAYKIFKWGGIQRVNVSPIAVAIMLKLARYDKYFQFLPPSSMQ